MFVLIVVAVNLVLADVFIPFDVLMTSKPLRLFVTIPSLSHQTFSLLRVEI